MAKSTRELEWFDLEIKAREVIHQQLDPVLSKAKEDREAFMNLKNYCNKLEKRVKELETSVLGDKPQETVIANIYETCSNIEGQRKKDVIRIDQDLNQIREHIKALGFSIDKINEEIICIHNNEKTTEEELSNIRKIIEDNKNIVVEEIAKIDENFKEMNNTYKEVSIKAEERSITAMNRAHTNTTEMSNYKREVENIRKAHLETLTMIREVKANKLDELDFTTTTGQIDIRFTSVYEQIGKIKDEINHRDRFIDRFLPLQTATMISDYMHSCLDPFRRKLLAEYENKVLQQLNNTTISSEPIDTREAKVQKILDNMKHMEERKVSFLTDVIKREPEAAPKEKKSQEKKKKNVEDSPSKPQTTEKVPLMIGPDIKEIELMIESRINPLQTSILKALQDEISQKQESNKGYFKAIIEGNNSLLNQVIQDFEENSKTYKRELSQISKDSSIIKITIEEHKKTIKNLENAVVHLTKMVVCLVENAQIEQALEAQDEEDRHAMVQTYEKELQSELVLAKPKGSPEPYSSGLPSGLGLQKKCLGCGNNSSMISGYKTTVMYKPTPLMYRNKKFERPVLISFRGKMVKECWEEVSPHIPWRQEDMENLVTEAYKNIKPNIVVVEDETNNLPVLSSATRNKSMQYRKTRFNKGSCNF